MRPSDILPDSFLEYGKYTPLVKEIHAQQPYSRSNICILLDSISVTRPSPTILGTSAMLSSELTIIDLTKGVYATTEFLEKFFRNLILNEQNELKNRNLQIDEIEKEAIQSAKQTDMDIPKCKNCTLDCTLEEIAVLNYLKEKPNATQKEIAQHIGKSERTVKSMTVNLSERGIIERKNGRRNGFWEIKK